VARQQHDRPRQVRREPDRCAVHPLVWAAAATIIAIGIILWTIGAPWSTVAVGIIAAGTVVGAAILGEDA